MEDIVERARAALDGVTPGEWSLTFDTLKDGFEGLNVSVKDVCVIGGCGCCGSPFGDNAHDARFIAAARSLVPDMADRIAALEADLARAEARLKEARADGLREAARTILTAMERAQIDMTILRKFMNGEPVAALTALARLKEGE